MQQIADWLQKLGVEQCAQRYPEHCINLERATPTLLPSNKRTPVSITFSCAYLRPGPSHHLKYEPAVSSELPGRGTRAALHR
jgi:hypothetical protein